MDDPLAALRPLHLPDPVAWWPPAPGWWLVGLLGLLAVASCVLWWQRNRARRAALAELRLVRVSALPPAELAASLSALLRRYALTCYPRIQVAGLSGDRWLEFLDTHCVGKGFIQGPGRVLAQGPYQPLPEIDPAGLYTLVGRWIRANPRKPRGPVQ